MEVPRKTINKATLGSRVLIHIFGKNVRVSDNDILRLCRSFKLAWNSFPLYIRRRIVKQLRNAKLNESKVFLSGSSGKSSLPCDNEIIKTFGNRFDISIYVVRGNKAFSGQCVSKQSKSYKNICEYNISLPKFSLDYDERDLLHVVTHELLHIYFSDCFSESNTGVDSNEHLAIYSVMENILGYVGLFEFWLGIADDIGRPKLFTNYVEHIRPIWNEDRNEELTAGYIPWAKEYGRKLAQQARRRE